MYLSFGMTFQETNTQVLELKRLYIDNRYILLSGQTLLVVNVNKIPGKGYLYIQYISSLIMCNWWCDASIPWYDTA